MKILICDDEQMILKIMRDVLEFKGHKALTCENVPDALSMLEGVDMVMTKTSLPGIGGEVLVEECKKRGIRVIIMGGIDLQIGEKLGVEFVNKPIPVKWFEENI